MTTDIQKFALLQDSEQITHLQDKIQKLNHQEENSDKQRLNEFMMKAQNVIQEAENESNSSDDDISSDSQSQSQQQQQQHQQQSQLQLYQDEQEQKTPKSQLLLLDEIVNQQSQRSIELFRKHKSELSELPNNPMTQQFVRADLIDDIYDLKQQLIDEGVNLDNLQLPDITTIHDIQQLRLIKNILRRKTTKLQSNSIVEDVIFMGLKGIENVFDGKTKIFGSQPNLKGLTKSFSLKMRNQRQHFAELFDNICENYGVGPNSKLLTQMVISSVKRAIINKDAQQSEDYTANMQSLQKLYNNQ